MKKLIKISYLLVTSSALSGCYSIGSNSEGSSAGQTVNLSDLSSFEDVAPSTVISATVDGITVSFAQDGSTLSMSSGNTSVDFSNGTVATSNSGTTQSFSSGQSLGSQNVNSHVVATVAIAADSGSVQDSNLSESPSSFASSFTPMTAVVGFRTPSSSMPQGQATYDTNVIGHYAMSGTGTTTLVPNATYSGTDIGTVNLQNTVVANFATGVLTSDSGSGTISGSSTVAGPESGSFDYVTTVTTDGVQTPIGNIVGNSFSGTLNTEIGFYQLPVDIEFNGNFYGDNAEQLAGTASFDTEQLGGTSNYTGTFGGLNTTMSNQTGDLGYYLTPTATYTLINTDYQGTGAFVITGQQTAGDG